MKRYCTLVALALFGLCSGAAMAQNLPPAQTFYIPLPEEQMLTALERIAQGITATNQIPRNPMVRYFGISVIGDGTIIYYDQHEDGYEANITNPTSIYDAVNNKSGTQIWGDGDPSNGAPPGVPDDILRPGQTLILTSEMNTPAQPTAAAPLFDGGDKIASTKAVSITTTVWSKGTGVEGWPGTLMSDATEVFDTVNWGTNYRVPVGTNIVIPGQSFEYVNAMIQAGRGGAAVEIRNPAGNTVLATASLSEGEAYLTTNNLPVGARITSDKPVQVDIITGDVGDNYESRWYHILPTNYWTSTYYTPVSTPESSRGRSDTNDTTGGGSTVFLYNPGASNITVSYITRNMTGVTTDVAKYVSTTNNFTSGRWTNSPVGDVYGPLVSVTATNTGFTNFGAPEVPWIGILPRNPTNNLSNRVASARDGGAAAVIVVNTNNAVNNLTNNLGALTIPVAGVYSNTNTAIRSTPLGNGLVSVSSTNAVVQKLQTTTTNFTSGVWTNSAPGNVYGPLVSITNTNTTVPAGPPGAWVGVIPRLPTNNLAARVTAARNAGAAALIVVNTNNTTTGLTNNIGGTNVTIPVVGVASNQNTAVRSAPLGNGWVRVSGNQVTNNITVSAGGWTNRVVTNGYGAKFTSTGGQSFYAVSATDSTGTTNSDNRGRDWGFSLVPDTALTPQSLVGLGFGRDPTSTVNTNENGSPVWVTSSGNGNTNATIYIDYDADPDTGDLIDPNGFRYDKAITLKELESVKVYNPSGNQSGMLLYTLDPGVKIATAWGQDPMQSSAGSPGFDGGTGIPPLPQFTAFKKSALFLDMDGDGYISPGDQIEYEIKMENVSRMPVSDMKVQDTLPDSVTYLAGTTTWTDHNNNTQTIADNPSAPLFPFTTEKTLSGTMPAFHFWTVKYRVQIKSFDDLPNGTISIINSAVINSQSVNEPVEVEHPQVLYGKIGDFVWVDTNGNGIQDSGEPGINGVTVNLLNSDGTPVLDGNGDPRTTTTATHSGNPGYYQFVGVPEGDYIIEFVTPSGYVFTQQNADSQNVNGGANSDPSPTNGRTPSFFLAAGQENNSVDAGMYEPGSISGTVLRDLSGDNEGDEPMAGVTVTLKDSNGNDIDSDPGTPGIQPTTTTTDGSGNYSFDNLPPGNYQVVQTVPGGFTAVNDADGDDFTVIGNTTPINIVSGTHVTDQDFVNQAPAAITGTVFDDLNKDGQFDGGDGKISGVIIYLYTDPNGDGDPSDGVLVGTTTTDGSGAYSFTGMPLGNYVVVEKDLFGYISVNDVQGAPADNLVAVAVTQLVTYTGKDFLDQVIDPELLGSISGQVRLDEDQDGNLADPDPGISGVTVQLWTDPNGDGDPSDGEMVLTTTTDGSGNYNFTDLPPGKYVVVEIDPAGHVSTADTSNPNDNRIPVDLPNSGNSTGNDFLDAASGGALATIGDTIWQDTNNNGIKDGGEPGIDGVVVWLYSAGQTPGVDAPYGVTTTSGGGQYQFANLPPGDYTIMIPPVNFLPGHALADAQTASSVVNTNDDGIDNDNNGAQTGGSGTAVLSPQFNLGNGEVDNTKDFGFVPTSSLGTISGSVMVDTNANGTLDEPPDEPLEGVTLTLVDASGNPILIDGNPITTTSAADGSYSFTNVPPGTYGVKMTDVPETYIGVSDIDGGLVDWIGDVTDINLPPGESRPGNDFLLRKRACPPTWEAWQDKWSDLGVANVTPEGNDDGDLHPNLIEFAFCMNPTTGTGSPYCMSPNVEAVDKVDLIYTTTAGGTTGVTYELQYAATLGENSTTWTTIPIPEESKVVTPQVVNGKDTGRDIVRVKDIEAVTGLQGGTGFVRMKVTVNTVEDGPVSATTGNDVGGWIQTPLDYKVRSFNDPFLQCPLFAGVISGVDGQDIVSAVSGGGVDYNDLVSAQPSYAEILSGPFEGHRFDIVGGGTNRFTAAIDNDIYSGDAPHSTLSAPSEGLAGAKFVVRPHRTIGNVFPTRAYVATDDPETASIVQMYAGDHWETLWLYDDGAGENAVPSWVSVSDINLNDRSGDVLTPGQGGFIYSRHPEKGGASFMLFGKVRPNDFIRPLKGTLDNVGGGYPLPQSPDGRAMTPADSGFYPNRSFSAADQFMIWRGDKWQVNDSNYDTYFLIGGTIAKPVPPDWLLTGDTTATKQNTVKHFAPDYSIMLKRKDPNPVYKMPLPWKADAE